MASERKRDDRNTPVGEEHPCVEMSEGVARYLMAISDLSKSGDRPTQARLARELEVSQPSALEMVRKLRGMGLVAEDGIELTAEGTSAALVLTSRRNAARDLTREVLGLEPEEAGLEAEQLASTASPALGRKLVAWRASRS
jgi:Mn-dependent DtxR family transcriptional regulator